MVVSMASPKHPGVLAQGPRHGHKGQAGTSYQPSDLQLFRSFVRGPSVVRMLWISFFTHLGTPRLKSMVQRHVWRSTDVSPMVLLRRCTELCTKYFGSVNKYDGFEIWGSRASRRTLPYASIKCLDVGCTLQNAIPIHSNPHWPISHRILSFITFIFRIL